MYDFNQFLLQWVTLIRRHAEEVVDDEIIFPIFKKFCKVLLFCAFICFNSLKLINFIMCFWFVLVAETSAS